MAWTAPTTFVGNTMLTAAQLNANLRDNMNETEAAKAANESGFFVATGANAIAERLMDTDRVNTSQTTTSVTFADLATVGPSVTVTTGTAALVFIMCQFEISVDNGFINVSFDVSGATTAGALDRHGITHEVSAADFCSLGNVVHYTGLTAGTNTFTMKYRVGSGTGTFANRFMAVLPL